MNSRIEELIRSFSSKGLRLSLAESCTGGMISSSITDVPGSSSVFMGSAVTYSNESKERILGVSRGTLLAHGAVSAETAEEMAKGSLKVYGSDIAASVTGIAGPGGATPEKPVGTVWMAVTDGKEVKVIGNHFLGDRASIRTQAKDVLIDAIIEFAERYQ